MAVAVVSISTIISFCLRRPAIAVSRRVRHCSSASSISLWMSGEMGNWSIVADSMRLSSRMTVACEASRCASASDVRVPSLSVSMAMLCVARSVSLASTA